MSAQKFPDSQADRLFRADPCARLLLLAHLESVQTNTQDAIARTAGLSFGDHPPRPPLFATDAQLEDWRLLTDSLVRVRKPETAPMAAHFTNIVAGQPPGSPDLLGQTLPDFNNHEIQTPGNESKPPTAGRYTSREGEALGVLLVMGAPHEAPSDTALAALERWFPGLLPGMRTELDLERKAFERVAQAFTALPAEATEKLNKLYDPDLPPDRTYRAYEAEVVFGEISKRHPEIRLTMEEQAIQSRIDARIQYARSRLLTAMALPRIPDEQLPAALDNGSNFLVEHCISPTLLEKTQADPALALALCRLAFAGPTELSCADMGNHNTLNLVFPHSSNLSNNPERAIGFLNRLEPGHPLQGALIFHGEQNRKLSSASVLTAMGSALDAGGEFSDLSYQTLMRLTDTVSDPSEKSSWDKLPPAGSWPLYDPGSPTAQFHKIPGAEWRGSLLNDSLAAVSTALSCANANPTRHIGATASEPLGPQTLKAMEREFAAATSLAPKVLACAISEISAMPSARSEIAMRALHRANLGFSEISTVTPSIENLLPGWLELKEQLRDQARQVPPPAVVGSATPAETDPSPAPSQAQLDDPLYALSLSASQVLGFSAHTPERLVGEAKAALMSQTGLSNGAWRAMSANPELASAFEKVLTAQMREEQKKALKRQKSLEAKSSKNTPFPKARPFEELYASANQMLAHGNEPLRKWQNLNAREQQSLMPEAAGRLLSHCAISNIEPKAQTRLLQFIAQDPNALCLLSAKLPYLPQAAFTPFERDPAPFALRIRSHQEAASALVEEQARLMELGPNFAKRVSERLERELKAGIKQGLPQRSAQKQAFQTLNDAFKDIVECASRSPIGFWAHIDRKEPLASALRQHDTWMANERERQANANPSLRKRWEAHSPALPDGSGFGFQKGKILARELTSGMELFDEGQAMSHCVGGYTPHCLSGRSRIFSLSIHGIRKSTLELSPTARGGAVMEALDFSDPKQRAKVVKWSPVQNRGPHNHSIHNAEILATSQEVATQFTEAFKAQTQLLAQQAAEQEKLAKLSASAAPKP